MSGSLGEVEHFTTMLSGCESINSGHALTPDGRYAFAVLKLHAVDFGSVAGQEGFLDNVKAAAGKSGEWLKKLIAAIKSWLTGSKKTTGDEEKANNAAKSKINEAVSKADSEKKEKMEAAAEATHKAVLPQIQNLLGKLNGLKSNMTSDAWEELGFRPEFDEVVKQVNEADKAFSISNALHMGTCLTRASWAMEAQIEKLTSALDKVDGDDDKRAKIGKAVGSKVQTMGAIVTGMNKLSEKLRHKLLDAFMTSDKPLTI